ncbi:hypothetical protein MOX02_58260 [Methylobacterium oxalidis]|uniref:Uncharacterized protein n=1 Tax=Methylobacterium oxalidis TaxID=944322 RepID=A0A512JCV3_9HYPH|nr:hypothetical protein MOX02_58260 [Methylobacterium oxalidis]GLS64380.1 hypothetical protein GCM10007888_27610 [Methylobacterium oxalidis]
MYRRSFLELELPRAEREAPMDLLELLALSAAATGSLFSNEAGFLPVSAI